MSHAVDSPPHQDFIIDAGWVLAFVDDTPRLLRGGSVRVRNDRIEEVRDDRISGSAPRIDARDQLLLPGLISTHTHAAAGTPTRGIIETGRAAIRPIEITEQLSDDEIDDVTAFNVAEMLRTGCTTHVEMSMSQKQAESYVRIAGRWGVRAYPGAIVPGLDRWQDLWFSGDDQVLLASVPDTLAEIDAYRAWALPLNGSEDDRIRPMMHPHAPDTHTPETLKACIAVAKELGNGIHIHVAQSQDEVDRVRRLWDKRPVEWLNDVGLFDERVICAHLWLADLVEDIPILSRDTVTFSHCPHSLGAGGSNGTQPFPELLAAGIRTSIGIDSHSNDYIEGMKLAVLDGRARYFLRADQSPTPMKLPTPRDAVVAATHKAAEALGRDDLGRIEPGAKADLCAIDVTSFLVGVGALPPEPLNNLLYANGLSVRHVVTDGHFQLWHGRLTVDDEQRIVARGGAAVEKIWRELRDEGWFEPEEPGYPPGWPFSWNEDYVGQ